MAFVINTLYILSATFIDVNGALVDPSVVTFNAKRPDGTVMALAGGSNPSTGIFTVLWEPDMGGDWLISIKSTSPDIHMPDRPIKVQSSFSP